MKKKQLPSSKLRFIVTSGCNLKCKPCHAEGVAQPLETKLSSERFRSIIQAAKKHGIRKVNITGGEPLLVEDELNEYIQVLKEEEILKIGLVTNGTKILESRIDFSNFYQVRISTHTVDEAKYELLTGTNQLSNVLAGISYLRKQNINVALNVMLLRGINDEEEDLINLVNFAEQQGVSEIQFMEVLPVNAFSREHYISKEEIQPTFSSLFTYDRKIDWGAELYRSEKGVNLVLMDCPCSGKNCDYCGEGKLSLYLNARELKKCMLGQSLPLGQAEHDEILFEKAMEEFYPKIN